MTIVYLRNAGLEDEPCWVLCAKGDPGFVAFSPVDHSCDALTERLLATLITLRNACQQEPAMQRREYVSLGIHVSNTIAEAERALSQPSASRGTEA